MEVRVVRLRYAHSDPLFWGSRLNVVSLSNVEAARALIDGKAQVGFIPVTFALKYCEKFSIIPTYAIYSNGVVYSSRLFKGSGSGYASVSDTTVSALAVSRLLGIRFTVVNDAHGALAKFGGVLVIGDEALRLVNSNWPHIVDTGELWRSRVGKPFVYAVMVASRGVSKDVVEYVNQAIEDSLSRFEANPGVLAGEVASRLGISRGLAERYLTSGIRYRVNGDVLEGLFREVEVLGLPNCVNIYG